MRYGPPETERSRATAPTVHRSWRRPRIRPLIIVGGQGNVAHGALRLAELVARRDRVNAHVVALMRPVEIPRWVLGAADADALQEGLRQQRHDRLRRQVHAIVGRSSYFSTEVLVSDSIRALRDAALESRAEYVLVGLDDLNAPDRLRNEQLVLRLAHVVGRPVLAVPRGCAALPMRALVAVDGDPSGEVAAHAAARMLAPGGTLTLAHVVPVGEGDELDTRDPLAPPARDAAERLERLASALRAIGHLAVETEVLQGDPATVLLELTGDPKWELIACGMRRGSGRRTPGMDSIAAAVLGGTSGAAVLIAPPVEDVRSRGPRGGGDR